MKSQYSAVLSAVLGLFAAAGTGRAAVVLSNLGQPNNGYDTVTYLSGPPVSESRLGAVFTTGSNPGGYLLESVSISLVGQFAASGNFTVSIYSSVSGAPGSLLATLAGDAQPSPGTGVTRDYSYAASGLSLAASTSYWVVNSVSGGVTGSYTWNIANSANLDFSATGWSLGSSYALFNPPDSPDWVVTGGDPYKLSIEATAVPEPAEYALLSGLGLAGVVFLRRRRAAR